MKKTLLLLLLLILFAGKTFSQDNQLDNLQFETANPQDESKQYFGVGIGYTGSLLFANMDKMNSTIKTNFGTGELKSTIYMHGIEGFIVTFKIPNLRIGLFGKSGTNVADYKDASNKTIGTIEYSAGFTGLNLEYAILPFKGFAIIPGFGGGFGKLSIESYKSDLNTFDSANNSSLKRIETNYWFVEPKLNFEYKVADFMVIRANASYLITFGQDWKYNRGATITPAPDGINSNGFAAQIGIFLGLFNY